MNKQQRIILTASSLILFLMALIPPWRVYFVYDRIHPHVIGSEFRGYRFVLSPPSESVIDSGVLLVQIMLLIAIVGGSLALSTRKVVEWFIVALFAEKSHLFGVDSDDHAEPHAPPDRSRT